MTVNIVRSERVWAVVPGTIRKTSFDLISAQTASWLPIQEAAGGAVIFITGMTAGKRSSGARTRIVHFV
jgi:hypothetical protein